MLYNLNIRWILIFSIIVASIYFIMPSYELYSIKSDPDLQDINTDHLSDDAIQLGLDLKGGLYIVLELDYASYLLQKANGKLSFNKRSQLESIVSKSINNALNNQTGVLYELEALSNKNNIALISYYSNLFRSPADKQNIDVVELLKEDRNDSMSSILEIMRNRIEDHNQYGMGEPSIQQLGSDRMVIELAGITDVAKAKDYVQRTAEFQLTLVEDLQIFKDLIFQIDQSQNNDYKLQYQLIPTANRMLALEDDYSLINQVLDLNKSVLGDKYKILWSNEVFMGPEGKLMRELALVRSKPAISSGQIQESRALISEFGNDDAGNWIVNLDMTTAGKVKWSRFTGNNIGKKVAIVLDDIIYMAPTIQAKISSGGTRITGFKDKQEAQDIASVLKAGELPAPINVVQINYIGPSLGQDSITSGALSMMIGLLLVFIFMLLYYNLSGLIANCALLINMLIIFAVLITMDAVLTLPGIAGLLLTIGMTVDANIIIFERIREELLISKSMRSAVHTGYNRAFLTILDANITTLITACVLSFIGSGPIKGFATTLSVGILCSMFTAVFITKTIFLTFIDYVKIKKLSI
jgi:SecD/SecF fusion protein